MAGQHDRAPILILKGGFRIGYLEQFQVVRLCLRLDFPFFSNGGSANWVHRPIDTNTIPEFTKSPTKRKHTFLENGTDIIWCHIYKLINVRIDNCARLRNDGASPKILMKYIQTYNDSILIIKNETCIVDYHCRSSHFVTSFSLQS